MKSLRKTTLPVIIIEYAVIALLLFIIIYGLFLSNADLNNHLNGLPEEDRNSASLGFAVVMMFYIIFGVYANVPFIVLKSITATVLLRSYVKQNKPKAALFVLGTIGDLYPVAFGAFAFGALIEFTPTAICFLITALLGAAGTVMNIVATVKLHKLKTV